MSIHISNISKSYKNVKALQDISFDVNAGELFGLIGPDGAGKTTLFRILTTLLIANEGTATVAGFDVVSDYKNIRNSVYISFRRHGQLTTPIKTKPTNPK